MYALQIQEIINTGLAKNNRYKDALAEAKAICACVGGVLSNLQGRLRFGGD